MSLLWKCVAASQYWHCAVVFLGKTLNAYFPFEPSSLPVVEAQPDERRLANKTQKRVLCVSVVKWTQSTWLMGTNKRLLSHRKCKILIQSLLQEHTTTQLPNVCPKAPPFLRNGIGRIRISIVIMTSLFTLVLFRM